MTDRLDLEAIKELRARAARGGWRALHPDEEIAALIAEVERLQQREAATKRAVDDFYEGRLGMPESMLLLRALYRRRSSESEEQAVSRSRSERGTEGVGLSGETAQEDHRG